MVLMIVRMPPALPALQLHDPIAADTTWPLTVPVNWQVPAAPIISCSDPSSVDQTPTGAGDCWAKAMAGARLRATAIAADALRRFI